MATKRKMNPAMLAALAARAQGAGAKPVAGIPGGMPDTGMPGGAPMGGMPGGPAGMKRGGGVKRMADGGNTSAGAGRGGQGGPTAEQAKRMFMSDAEKAARDEAAESKMQKRTDDAYNAASKNMNFKKGGSVSSASSRADGVATKGKTKGRFC
jgi:hypothetical protein